MIWDGFWMHVYGAWQIAALKIIILGMKGEIEKPIERANSVEDGTTSLNSAKRTLSDATTGSNFLADNSSQEG